VYIVTQYTCCTENLPAGFICIRPAEWKRLNIEKILAKNVDLQEAKMIQQTSIINHAMQRLVKSKRPVQI